MPRAAPQPWPWMRTPPPFPPLHPRPLRRRRPHLCVGLYVQGQGAHAWAHHPQVRRQGDILHRRHGLCSPGAPAGRRPHAQQGGCQAPSMLTPDDRRCCPQIATKHVTLHCSNCSTVHLGVSSWQAIRFSRGWWNRSRPVAERGGTFRPDTPGGAAPITALECLELGPGYERACCAHSLMQSYFQFWCVLLKVFPRQSWPWCCAQEHSDRTEAGALCPPTSPIMGLPWGFNPNKL